MRALNIFTWQSDVVHSQTPTSSNDVFALDEQDKEGHQEQLVLLICY